MSSIRSVVVLTSSLMERVRKSAPDVIDLLRSNNLVATHIETDLTQPLTKEHIKQIEDVDLVILLGGDGSFIQAGRSVAEIGVPMLGVNFGHLGFLTELEGYQLPKAVGALLAGEIEVKERMMLEARAIDKNGNVSYIRALNDMVLRSQVARLIQLDISINDCFVYRLKGDGLIVSTAAGSTAYALSAMGPIIDSELEVIEMLSINAHLCFRHPLVMPSDKRIDIDICDHRISIFADGRESISLEKGQKLQISRAALNLKVVQFKGSEFYHKLQSKLNSDDRSSTLDA